MPVLGGAVDFRILGPLEVVAEGRFLDIGAPKLRAVLAALLLEPNRVVSDDRLIESVWDETPPESAQKALQVYVSHLRKLLGGERVQRIGPGYALRVDPGELDLDRFELLRDEGKLHEALALWRGPPLAEFEYERFARSDIERLEELRLACLEERLDRDLAEGRHAKLVSELEQLAAEHPQRERLRAQLMLALYRSGRQAEALEAYQDARRELVETLGIDPGRPLRELEQAILRQDPSLDLAPPTAAEPIAKNEPRGVFVGRESEVAELLAGLEDVLAGRGRLFLIAGEPGIGKSRLAEELAVEARRRGALVLVGRCWEAGGAPAYWPWVQALRAYIGAVEQEALKAQLGTGGPDLLQLLPELGGLVSGAPAPDAFASEGARFRLFDAMAAFLGNAAAARPLVLVLDDLHAADEPSLLLLRFLARELGSSRLLVAAAYRDVDPELRDPLTTALAELGRERVTRTLSLGGLGASDIASFIELTTDRTAAPGLATTLHTETAGNPLFVGEIVRLLAAEGRLDDASAAQLSVPENVRGVIGRRLDRLSDGCASLLGFASVFGREFDLDALARLCGFEQTELLELLDEAVRARLVSELPGALGRMRFAHALIRDTVYEGLGRARRAQLHRQAGEAVEALHAGDRDSQLTELAYHFSEAASVGEVQKAVDYCRLAGGRAIRLLAYEEAVRLFRMALALTRSADATRCEVLLAIGDAQARSGDAAASKQTFQEAAELAGSLGLSEQLGRAALGYGGRIIWDVSRDADYLESVIERALAALPDEDSALRVRLLARLACGPLRGTSAGRERKDAVSRQALEMARRLGDTETLSYAITAYIASHHSPDFTREQLELAGESLELATASGNWERVIEAHEHRLVSFLELGEMEAAKAELAAILRLAERLKQPAQQWFGTVYEALVTLLEGELEEAERLIFSARDLGRDAQGWNAVVSFGLQFYVLRSEQGRATEVEEFVHGAIDDYPTYPIWRCVAAHLAARLGRDDAESRFDALASEGFADLVFDEEWVVEMTLLAEAASWLGDARRAGAVYERLLPYADRVAVSYPEVSTGGVSRYLGLLAAVTARPDEAIRHLEDALALHERMGARTWLAHTRHDLSRVLLARSAPGDRERAEELLRDSLATYRELGMESHAADALALDRG